MEKIKSEWISLRRLTFSNSVADLADAIESHGIYLKDEYGRARLAPKRDKSGGHKSVDYALERLKSLYQEQSNPGPVDPYEGEFDRDDEDPLYHLGWTAGELPTILSTDLKNTDISTLASPTPSTNKSDFIPRSPSGLADLFKCYDSIQWKRLSKNCINNPWLLEALAKKGIGSRPSTYYPDIVAEALVKQGEISQETANKILYKEAPEHLKDYYQSI